MEFKSNKIKKTNKTNIVETVDGSDYLLTDKVYEVCEFLEKNGEWELSGKISDCWNPQLGIKNKSELLRTIGEYLKNNWDRRANTVTPIISKLRELENEKLYLKMKYRFKKLQEEFPETFKDCTYDLFENEVHKTKIVIYDSEYGPLYFFAKRFINCSLSEFHSIYTSRKQTKKVINEVKL